MIKMFTYSINNPNNFVIATDYFTIPIGRRCPSAIACNYGNIRKFSLPFDWNTNLSLTKIQNVLKNNFDDFIPDVYNGIFKNKYGISLAHFNPNIKEGVEEYKRRINRFKDIITQQKKIYFVYVNEDYLYNNVHRQDTFNDTVFNEMLEFEKFIRTKYINIDYNILYFNFRHDTIPTNSNIINIVLHSSTLYDQHDASPFLEFRKYCGKILSIMFNTTVSFGGENSLFRN